MNFETWLKAQHPEISFKSAEAVLRLSSEGATLPFIARYRKEQTGNLDEVAIGAVIDGKERFDQIVQRQTFIVEEIEKQGKLTPELKEKLLATFDSAILEDLYLPYKQKRRTKAQIARDAGLGPLADWIWGVGHGEVVPEPGQTLALWAFTFKNEKLQINDAETAIDGAIDILIERLSEDQTLRQTVRTAYFEQGNARTEKAAKAKPNSKFELYFDHVEPVTALMRPESSHRYLAMRRGWLEEELTFSIGGKKGEEEAFEASLLQPFESSALSVSDAPTPIAQALQRAARLAFKAYVAPSIDSEVHKALREVADAAAIQVFSSNVRKLLLSAPYGAKAVLGVDPGLRTGCKLALVDDDGKYLASAVIHLQSPAQEETTKTLLREILKNDRIRAVAVGNGTAGRETERFFRTFLKELDSKIPVTMVSEAGASVYSASEVAREEFPDLDVTVRGAISIARRLQDPLAELVKVDPKSIGVGQYQHDVSQPALKRALETVVDSCVNQVGVNLNTASPYLLSRVSGIGPALARAVVARRNEKGVFKNRAELLEVPRFTDKVFEQAAGFLRIPDSDHPLDNTGVHPERYSFLEGLAVKLGKEIRSFLGAGAQLLKQEKSLRDEVGHFTFDDMIADLEKPGRDPREEFVPFQFRDDIHEVKDLQKDMICPGIVTNITNFGAFVDIGVHQDGLVHVSQLSHQFIKDPLDAVSVGDRVTVRVLEVNREKNQISLSIKAATEAPKPSGKPAQRESRGERPARGENSKRPNRKKEPPARAPSPEELAAAAALTLPTPNGARPKREAPKLPQARGVFNNAFAGLAALKKDLPK